MKIKIANAILCLGLGLIIPAYAHGPMPAQYGGIVQVVNDVQYELVNKGGAITIYVDDHDEPVPTAGMSGKLTALVGSEKIETTLEPGKANELLAKDAITLKPGTKLVASIKSKSGQVSQIRFTIK
jgi:hypothetical protein